MKRILLKGSWQTKNIGDIAHTPGMLRLARDYWPDAEMRLWPEQIDRGVREMLTANFPDLKIVETGSELDEAFAQCDLLLHGSGPCIARSAVNLWRERTNRKPYGFYGVSADGLWSEEKKEVLAHASFIFCRDSLSEHFLLQQGLDCPVIRFTPDSTFALKLEKRNAAETFLHENGLEAGKFICVIPRLRCTPSAFDEEHFEYSSEWRRRSSEDHVESDMAKMREIICAVVTRTDLKVLICPEMTYQVPMGRRYLYERLPEEIRRKVVLKREYWITDEAQSVYAKAHSLVSMEMHSPIIFITEGKPAILLRQAEDTFKGQMWRDLGLQDWIFELNSSGADEIIHRVFDVIENYPAARKKAAAALARAEKTAAANLALVRDQLIG